MYLTNEIKLYFMVNIYIEEKGKKTSTDEYT